MTFASILRGALTSCLVAALAAMAGAADPWVVYEGGEGPGRGKHVVLISGDEEYRSEEALPMLGKILATRHGLKATVLFAINSKTGEIDPANTENIPGLEALKTADLVIIATRFRNLPDEQMQHLADYLAAGKPIIGLRTATHAFKIPANRKFHRWSFEYKGKDFEKGFGQQILGQTWVNHHGHHGKQGTRGIVAPGEAEHPIFRGIQPKEIWGDSDVYTVELPLPKGCRPLVLGQVLQGMKPDDAPLDGPKNDPMMPIVWEREYTYEGKQGKAICSTLGAASDLTEAGSRRMLVNAAYYLLGLGEKIPKAGTAVELVGAYQPSPFRFGGFKRGVKPADLALPEASGGRKPPVARHEETGGLRPPLANSLELKPGDKIAILGNTLAERMQHDGWLEARLQSRYPTHKLTLRNLGFSGDEFNNRQRSSGFGSPDEWLKRVQADVVIGMFGYGESFHGPAGIETFKREVAQFVTNARAQKYNGQTAPRLVLVSPPRFENLKDRNLPDGTEHNVRLKLYSDAMGEVAKQLDVPFVDLFTASGKIFEIASEPLTINGVHFNERGNQLLASAIDEALFGPAPPVDDNRFALLRAAVKDKNFYWFHRYRTTDGYSIYGGRSGLRFVGGQTNRDVMQREMAVLDAMTANRDARVWAVAQGGELKVDDSKTPPFLEVKSNKPGAGPGGKHIFLSGEESVSRMKMAPGMKVNLFASEEKFPELVNPVQMAWDAKGRLWVCAWPSYPHWKPKDKMDDKLLILEDTDGDGKADRCKTFAGGLHNPTGFEFFNGGVLVAVAPNIVFLKDTDGDDVADVRKEVLHGIDSADTHHTASSFVLGPDGSVYFQEGVFHRSQIETPYGVVRNRDAAVWKFDPKTYKVERYSAYGYANPHGHVFDRWGQDFIYDGTGAEAYHGAIVSGYLDFPQEHPRAPQIYRRRTRPCPGVEILSSRHFPEKNQGNLLVPNVIGFQGILQYVLRPEDSSYVGTEVEPIVSSDDSNFRPVDVEMGPDGAMYFTDWQNPIIGHMQHNLRDPNRDQTHGRVFRIVAEGRPLLTPPKIAGEPIEKLLELLKEPEDRVRYRVRIELSGRSRDEVLPALDRWVAGLDPKDPQHEHHLLEALWANAVQHQFNPTLLKRVLNSSEPRARAAATRLLCDQRGDNPSALEWLKERAADAHPLVRLEAVRGASFFRTAEAMEIPLIAAEFPSDRYLDYVRKETNQSLDPLWKKALASGEKVRFTTPIGLRHILRSVSTEQLLTLPRDKGIYLELLHRNGVADEHRRAALTGLAGLEKRREIDVLLDTINGLDTKQQGQTVAFDLVRLLSSRKSAELAEAKPRLRKMATEASLPLVRQIGFVALIKADGKIDETWKLAQESASRTLDLVSAMRLIPDPNVKATLYPLVAPLLEEKAAMPPSAAGGQPRIGRFVRIELEGRRTLTLAEVEVISQGKNIARTGTASQIDTMGSGDARRAIDGNTSPNYADNGQTHTNHNVQNPWWEVDLGTGHPIDSIVVHNRGEGFESRLQGFSLRVLDSQRNVIFIAKNLAAPTLKETYRLSGEQWSGLIRRAAIEAVASVRGEEAKTFALMAKLIRQDVERPAAIRAIQQIPRAYWPADGVAPLLDDVMSYLGGIPLRERSSNVALDSAQLADALASLMPADKAKTIRAQLGEMTVQVLRIGTVPHRMAYDKERLAVQAGRTVEIIFDNSDLMPHNFVILEPGALEEVGLLAEATAQQPGAAERHYVPSSGKILLSSHLIDFNESQRLTFTAPKKPGVYPFVCTYPGHWRRMYGALYVVDSLEKYQADPEAYLTVSAIPTKDELLKFSRPRTAWKFQDLASSVETLEPGRSFASGRQMFRVAGCVSCHRTSCEGSPVGPDLAALDPKRPPAEVLRDILEPSWRINEKYQTYVIETDQGRIITGLILEEADGKVKIIDNPVVKAEPIVLGVGEIADRQKSSTSIMPQGLLDKLSREEILDLLAFVYARGDEKHQLFHGGDEHQHEAAK